MGLQDDLPSESYSESYASIAHRVVGEVRLINGVIGIIGPWGSGKSSLIRAIFNEAENTGIPRRNLVYVNTWGAVTPTDQRRQFFQVLGIALGVTVGLDAIQALYRYADLLTGAAAGTERLLSVLQRIVNVISLVGVGSIALIETTFIQLLVLAGSVALFTFGPILFGGAWVLRLAARIRWGIQPEESLLDALRRRVSDALRLVGDPVIVALEDIDRVNPDTARDILKMVRENANFDNLTYLIPLDELTLTHILGEGSKTEPVSTVDELFDRVVEMPTTQQTG